MTSTVQPDFDREKCNLASGGNPSNGIVANTNKVDPIPKKHSRLSYVKPLCVTTATNLMELAEEETSKPSRMMLFTYPRLDVIARTPRKQYPSLGYLELDADTSKSSTF